MSEAVRLLETFVDNAISNVVVIARIPQVLGLICSEMCTKVREEIRGREQSPYLQSILSGYHRTVSTLALRRVRAVFSACAALIIEKTEMAFTMQAAYDWLCGAAVELVLSKKSYQKEMGPQPHELIADRDLGEFMAFLSLYTKEEARRRSIFECNHVMASHKNSGSLLIYTKALEEWAARSVCSRFGPQYLERSIQNIDDPDKRLLAINCYNEIMHLVSGDSTSRIISSDRVINEMRQLPIDVTNRGEINAFIIVLQKLKEDIAVKTTKLVGCQDHSSMNLHAQEMASMVLDTINRSCTEEMPNYFFNSASTVEFFLQFVLERSGPFKARAGQPIQKTFVELMSTLVQKELMALLMHAFLPHKHSTKITHTLTKIILMSYLAEDSTSLVEYIESAIHKYVLTHGKHLRAFLPPSAQEKKEEQKAAADGQGLKQRAHGDHLRISQFVEALVQQTLLLEGEIQNTNAMNHLLSRVDACNRPPTPEEVAQGPAPNLSPSPQQLPHKPM